MNPPDVDATELPPSPGARLRSEREAQGISHQQAAESLNLDTMVLAHLEANDFAALGAPVFARGHLRRYTTMLGLDEDELDEDGGAMPGDDYSGSGDELTTRLSTSCCRIRRFRPPTSSAVSPSATTRRRR